MGTETSVLLLASPEHTWKGEWLTLWRDLMATWPWGWDTARVDSADPESWRRRALEGGRKRWVVLADPGCAPGALALFEALQIMVNEPKVACVCLVPIVSRAFLPELSHLRSALWRAPFAPGGVAVVKDSAVVRSGLPEPGFYPYDLAEMTFRMACKGLEILVLLDPSFVGPPACSFSERLRSNWLEGRGSAAFRLAYKGRAPRSLRLPGRLGSLLLMSPWLVPSTAWRMARRSVTGWAATGWPASSRRADDRSLPRVNVASRLPCAFIESLAFLGGVLTAYTRRQRIRDTHSL